MVINGDLRVINWSGKEHPDQEEMEATLLDGERVVRTDTWAHEIATGEWVYSCTKVIDTPEHACVLMEGTQPALPNQRAHWSQEKLDVVNRAYADIGASQRWVKTVEVLAARAASEVRDAPTR